MLRLLLIQSIFLMSFYSFQEEEGWWRGSVRGQEGLFPSNFVEVMNAAAEADENDKNEKKEQNGLYKICLTVLSNPEYN
jgi:hypothetical protein